MTAAPVSKEDDLARQADTRAGQAWDARYRHRKAAQDWSSIASGLKDPQKKKLYEQLAEYMNQYADADAAAEKAFRELAAEIRGAGDAVTP